MQVVEGIKGRFRRRKLALLALFALLFQTIAPLSPMPAMRITTAESLVLALADLCRPGEGTPDKSRGGPAHGGPCEICLTIALAGPFIAPAPPPLFPPVAVTLADWRLPAPDSPSFIHAVGVQPRGPPLPI